VAQVEPQVFGSLEEAVAGLGIGGADDLAKVLSGVVDPYRISGLELELWGDDGGILVLDGHWTIDVPWPSSFEDLVHHTAALYRHAIGAIVESYWDE
jgi:hypothetical protein